MIRQYSRDKWEQYWKEKLGIKGYFDIEIMSVNLPSCKHFGTLLIFFIQPANIKINGNEAVKIALITFFNACEHFSDIESLSEWQTK